MALGRHSRSAMCFLMTECQRFGLSFAVLANGFDPAKAREWDLFVCRAVLLLLATAPAMPPRPPPGAGGGNEYAVAALRARVGPSMFSPSYQDRSRIMSSKERVMMFLASCPRQRC